MLEILTHKPRKFVFNTICVVLLCSCSSEVPTRENVASSIERQFKEQVKAEMISFERINGVEKAVDGYQTYEVFYNADIKLLASKSNQNDYFVNYWGSAKRIMSDTIYLPTMYRIQEGSAMFVKTENGWKPYKNDFGTMTLLEDSPESKLSTQVEKEKTVDKADTNSFTRKTGIIEHEPYKAIVITDKSFFYYVPANDEKVTAYVQKGDTVLVTSTQTNDSENWVLVEFTNTKEKQTVGYLNF